MEQTADTRQAMSECAACELTRDIGDTSRDSTLILGLYTFCFAKPGSMTYTIPSMVKDVSAMFVETTIFLPAMPFFPGGGACRDIKRTLHDSQPCNPIEAAYMQRLTRCARLTMLSSTWCCGQQQLLLHAGKETKSRRSRPHWQKRLLAQRSSVAAEAAKMSTMGRS